MDKEKFDGKCFFSARELDIIAYALDKRTSDLLAPYQNGEVNPLPNVIQQLKPYTELRNKIANYQSKLNGTK